MTTIKKCRCCGLEKTASEFGKDKSRKDGLDVYCKGCKRAKGAKYREDNPEKERERHAEYRAENREKERERSAKYRTENRERERERHAQYRAENREKELKRKLKWQKDNRESVNSYAAKRRALKLERLHPEHDPAKERELYNRAKELEQATGEKYHVDHVLPLAKGGWHHHGNMQILPASVNQQKNDSLEWRNPNYLHWTQLPLFLLQGTL